jgi:hypothetical protein
MTDLEALVVAACSSCGMSLRPSDVGTTPLVPSREVLTRAASSLPPRRSAHPGGSASGRSRSAVQIALRSFESLRSVHRAKGRWPWVKARPR